MLVDILNTCVTVHLPDLELQDDGLAAVTCVSQGFLLSRPSLYLSLLPSPSLSLSRSLVDVTRVSQGYLLSRRRRQKSRLDKIPRTGCS